MGRMKSETAIFAEAVLSTASTSRTLFVDAFPIISAETTRVELPPAEIMSIIAATKPRVLYLHH